MDIRAQDILMTMFNPDEKICFRIFDDKKSGVFSGAKLEVEAGKYATIEKTLESHNEKGRGIFYVVNFGGHEDKAISRINAQFVEMDDISLEEQQKAVDAFPLPPSMIIKTRKSLHVYWLVTNAKVEMFRTVQKQLVTYFHGDPMCVNESRVTADVPDWYRPTQQGLKFLPGVLAEKMAKNEDVLYVAEQHYVYSGGVYDESSEMDAQRMVQKKMIPAETTMSQIADTERQWRLRIKKDIREMNSNPFIINVKNGLYNVLEDTLTEHTPTYYSTV